MAPSAVVEQDDLTQNIERLEDEIGLARADIAEWEGKERECNGLLTELRQSYIEAAGLKVQGKSSPVDALTKRIDDLKEKSIGFAHVITTKRQQLADLQARMQPLNAEQSQRAQARMIVEEKSAVEQTVASMEQSLADLNRAATSFANGLQSLRSRQYLSETNKHLAFDNAATLERRIHGLRG